MVTWLNGVGINCSYMHFACVRAVCMSLCARVSSRRASHVCAHRTLQRVPLNTRYTFKKSSMFNGVGINCSYVHFACVRASNAATSTFEHSMYFTFARTSHLHVVHIYIIFLSFFFSLFPQGALRMFARIERFNEYLWTLDILWNSWAIRGNMYC